MGGFDGLVMGNLAEALKFNVQLVRADVKYGRLLHNKSFIGSLGDVVHKRADVAFNSRFVIDYATDEIDFMFPVLGERVCVIAPSALQIPQWTAIFKCFSLTVWIALWTVATLSGFFWFSLKKVHRFAFRRRKGKKKTFSARDLLDLRSTVVKVWIIMLGAPIEMPARNMERLFVATCLVLNLIIAGTFQVSRPTETLNKRMSTISGCRARCTSRSARFLITNKSIPSKSWTDLDCPLSHRPTR